MRILLFSERLRAPYDEGIKNVALHLAAALVERHQVLTLTCGAMDDPGRNVVNVRANRLLLSLPLSRMVRRFEPQGIVYVPTACATVFSFLRARVLGQYGRGVPTVLVTLQPRPYAVWQGRTIRWLLPHMVLAQSTRTAVTLSNLGCRTGLLPPAVDGQRFRPSTAQAKTELRSRYRVPRSCAVTSHVGHLKGKRNLLQLLALQATPGNHVVVVGSSSTQQEGALKDALRRAGATVIDNFVQSIEDIYRLSDVYVFLAEEPTAAIEVPLSVLEAMACNVPVVCTRFGGLSDFFPVGQGLFYWRGEVELGTLIKAALAAPSSTRKLVEPFTWAAAADVLASALCAREGAL